MNRAIKRMKKWTNNPHCLKCGVLTTNNEKNIPKEGNTDNMAVLHNNAIFCHKCVYLMNKMETGKNKYALRRGIISLICKLLYKALKIVGKLNNK